MVDKILRTQRLIILKYWKTIVGAQHFYHRLGARHQEINLWQPPGNGQKRLNDMLFDVGKMTILYYHTILREGII